MTPRDMLEAQTKQIQALNRIATKLTGDLKVLKTKSDADSKVIRELKIGHSFRAMIERAAEMVVPFHYMTNLTLTANSTTRVRNTIQTSSKGWFFADRVFASFRPTAGANAGEWRPLTHSHPAIAVQDVDGGGANPLVDILDFDWEYSENRTNMERQNDQLTIPGDLLARRDNDGYLLGGDPWAPRSTITVGATPRVALTNAGVLTFTFLGSLCLNTDETALQSWVERKQILGV